MADGPKEVRRIDSVLDRVYKATEQVIGAGGLVSTLTDKCCGPQTRDVADDSTEPESVAVFPKLEQLAGRLEATAAQIEKDVGCF